MPHYQCHFFNKEEQVVRTEALGSSDDRDACREARMLMGKTGSFAGYEVSENGRRVDIYRPRRTEAS
jgi:hypothetical protein